MVDPKSNALALYLCSWLHDPENPTPFLEDARETIEKARETFARRGMNIDDSLRSAYEQRIAEQGLDQPLFTWAQRTAVSLENGTLPHDPEHRDTPSPYSLYGSVLTYGELQEIYAADLPDGS